MNFNRFEHINMACKDMEATARFYQILFPDWRVRAEGTYNGDRWMHLGNHQFYLALNNAPTLERVHPLYEAIGVNHVGFVIEDGEKMQALLGANGIEYYTLDSPETKYRIYVFDPDGNEVELVEYQSTYSLR
jgi:catechol 2,3-dioxygenase-like lactoylglutathione lyase family enzyme